MSLSVAFCSISLHALLDTNTCLDQPRVSHLYKPAKTCNRLIIYLIHQRLLLNVPPPKLKS